MDCTEYMELFLKDHHNMRKSDAKLCYQYKCALGGPIVYEKDDDKLLSLYMGKKPVKEEMCKEEIQLQEEIEKMQPIWKAEIEKSFTELADVIEELHPVEFNSEFWSIYGGAYGDVLEDVAFLFCREDLIPETTKIRRLDFEEKGYYEIIFDNLWENLTHQLSMYPEIYLAVPYLVMLLEKKKREGKADWEFKIISVLGDILATDIIACGGGQQGELPEQVWESYQKSVKRLQKMTKEYLVRNKEALKNKGIYFAIEILSILADPEAAYEMLIGSFEQLIVECPNCEYYDDSMEIDGIEDEKLLSEIIEPAEAVTGNWDWQDFSDTYVWFSHLAQIVDEKEAWKVKYYYGTYTCPECGSKGVLIEWMKEADRKGY